MCVCETKFYNIFYHLFYFISYQNMDDYTKKILIKILTWNINKTKLSRGYENSIK